MTASFDISVAYTLGNEGTVYTNYPDDRGGPTKMGITLKTLTAWRAKNNGPVPTGADVVNLTKQQAEAIYKSLYWDVIHGELLADQGIADALFDASVLCGVVPAVKTAQKIANAYRKPEATALKIDGQCGPKTVAVLNSMERSDFLEEFVMYQADTFLDIVRRDATQRSNLKGWLKRTVYYLDLNF